ncbi:MAG: EamA family transporter [Desulfitobacteriaceae bacterium]
MTATDYRTFGIALFSIFLGATGQFLFRLGMLHFGKVSIVSIWRQLFGVIFTPTIFLGFICFGISSILWLVIISRWQLNFAYPLVALGYVFVIIYGTVFLQEALTLPKVIGIVIILIGISILGFYGSK